MFCIQLKSNMDKKTLWCQIKMTEDDMMYQQAKSISICPYCFHSLYVAFECIFLKYLHYYFANKHAFLNILNTS